MDKIKNAQSYYDNAKQKKDLADYCMSSHRYKQAIPCDYYYIFNLCRIIYSLEETDTSQHKTLIGQFNKKYVHEKQAFDRGFGSFLHALEKQRGLCDYEPNYSMDKEFAMYLHEETENFAQSLIEYIQIYHKEVLSDFGLAVDRDEEDELERE